MAQSKKKPVPMRSRRSGLKKMKLIKQNLEILNRIEKELKS